MRLTYEQAHAAFRYEDGVLYYREKQKRTRSATLQVGKASKRGVMVFAYKKQKYFVHHVVYLMHYKAWPHRLLHRDGDFTNNTLANLEHRAPKPKRQRQVQSGFTGVEWSEQQRKWLAQIKVNGRQRKVGYYESRIKAAIAYDSHARGLGQPLNFPHIVK